MTTVPRPELAAAADRLGTTAVGDAGLTSAQAAERLARFGPNRLPQQRRPAPLLLLLRQATNFFALMLWLAAVLAVVAGMPVLGGAIAIVVLVNAGFAFVQEYRADQAAEKLRDLLPTTVTVRRDDRRTVVSATALVRGDTVLLTAGDRVSADLMARQAVGLSLDESMLTGESVPRSAASGEQLWAGTFVVGGEAEAIVERTGGETRLGEIAAMTQRTKPPVSPLALRLHRVVKVIAIIALVTGGLFFGIALLLGIEPTNGFLLAIGVTVALVPEGLLPTVTLSLARAAQQMAKRHALVKRLDSVETLGSTTFICTDKTGTLTRNEMSVSTVWTPAGTALLHGTGYEPDGTVEGTPAVTAAVTALAHSAVWASTGRAVQHDGTWRSLGDPMEAALHVLALRAAAEIPAPAHADPAIRRFPFDPARRRESVLVGGVLHVKGAPDAVLPNCRIDSATATAAATAIAEYGAHGLRMLAVARSQTPTITEGAEADTVERDLELLGIVGLVDPVRPDVAKAVAACRRAGIRLAMITGDHPATARAVASEVGLLGKPALVVEGRELPLDDDHLGALLDHDGVVVCRVTPEQKLRIARSLQGRGHVVAMTGDGVNDAPALRQADIGIAMGASGTDVAREAADLVLLDDHFATIVAAIEQGRATFANIRRFLTYHLTDNVAELAPFAAWAVTGGSYPLALSVLQILALDIGTDLLPALALGSEPPDPRTLNSPPHTGELIDRSVVVRAFGLLGPVEAAVELGAFTAVLLAAGWHWGVEPAPAALATASGAAFVAVVFGQLANAFACRSEYQSVFTMSPFTNRLLLWAVAAEAGMLLLFLTPPVASALGGTWPSALGWAVAAAAIPALLGADAAAKAAQRHDLTASTSPPRPRTKVP